MTTRLALPALAALLLVACSAPPEGAPQGVVGFEPDAAPQEPSALADASAAHDAEPALDAGTDAHPDAHAPVVPPAAVVACMKSKPYVEETCAPTVVKGWPYPAQRCTYSSPIGTLAVDVADPTATQVGAWILTAARAVPWVAGLEKTEPKRFLEVMQIMAVDVMLQSGRIFPLKGVIGEAMDNTHYIGYPFTDGVADGCPPSEPHCYCRIDSLTRGMYCAYRGAHGLEGEATCRTRVGYAKGDTAEWYAECVDNHKAAWASPDNAHFVAKLWALLHDAGISGTPTGAQVTAALYSQLGMSSKDVASFCP